MRDGVITSANLCQVCRVVKLIFASLLRKPECFEQKSRIESFRSGWLQVGEQNLRLPVSYPRLARKISSQTWATGPFGIRRALRGVVEACVSFAPFDFAQRRLSRFARDDKLVRHSTSRR